MEIHDKNGVVIASSNPPETRNFDCMTIRGADLAGLELEGISFGESDLRDSNFTNADLYGAYLCDSDLSRCVLRGADLRNSFIHNVKFCDSDLRGARLSLDEMGGALVLHSADFTGANLEGADFTGALYDERTIFPKGFDPEEHGLGQLDSNGS